MDHENRLGKDVETLKDDISKLKEDLGSIAETLLEKGKAETEAAKDKLSDSLKEEIEAARLKSREGVESLEDQIREKPLMSLLIAFVIGLFLGKLFDRG
ncbi:MAG: hypothetical protein AAF462_03105 [Thermodesulfobacteriota bacterium]